MILGNIAPTYASELEGLALEYIHANEEVASIEVNDDLFESISAEYDLADKMDETFLEEISDYAEVEQSLSEEDGLTYVTYTFKPNTPSQVITYESGNSEELGSIYSITYVTADETGSKTGTTTLSDLTFKNVMNYSYYTSGYNTAIKVTSGTCTITKFYESNLRDLEIDMGGIGVPATSGPATLSASKSFSGTVTVGKTYKCTTGWSTYYLESETTSFSMDSTVTYSHGNSNYTVSSKALVLTNA